jgi:hypothetical protein
LDDLLDPDCRLASRRVKKTNQGASVLDFCGFLLLRTLPVSHDEEAMFPMAERKSKNCEECTDPLCREEGHFPTPVPSTIPHSPKGLKKSKEHLCKSQHRDIGPQKDRLGPKIREYFCPLYLITPQSSSDL